MKLINRRKKTMNDIQEPERKPMSMREIDALPENPFIIRKDRYLDPNDPNLSLEEKKRLRNNWNKRRNYKRKREHEKHMKVLEDNKLIEKVIELKAKQYFEKHREVIEKKDKKKDDFYNE
jgi:hypothetical protein